MLHPYDMRFLFLLIATLALASPQTVDSDISDFMAEVTEAVKKQDMSIIQRLSYDVDVPQEV